jgi:choice-of-anchor B domain-containing protein
MMKRILLFVSAVLSMSAAWSQTECVDGFAGVYPCQHVDLMYFMEPSEFGGGTTNEVWGWTDPLDGKEYVLLGKSNGVGFIDIEDPTNPIYLGTLPTHTNNSIWRTLRVYNNYMFVGSEANGHGMQVFDLTRLRNVINPPQIFTEDAHYAGFGKCHTLVIDEDNGFVYAVGTNTFSGGLHVVNIQNPLAPVIAGGFSSDGYTHEAIVTTYSGPDADYTGKTVVYCFNGTGASNFTIVDATDKTDIQMISTTPYPSLGYCHQGHFTPDGNYLLMNDELDEYNGLFSNTRTLIWDIHDLDDPVFMGNHIGSTTAIDHNLYILGNLCYQSNYTAGLRILDVTDIATAQLSEVAYFDHYPANNSPVFDGTWMNYPYFESGIIPVTDIDFGLFLLQPNFISIADVDAAICSLEEAVYTIEVADGFAGPVNLSVTGLPPGATYTLSSNDVLAPATVTLSVQFPILSSGTFMFNVVAEGLHNTYQRAASAQVDQAFVYYQDSDFDGFGDLNNSIADCIFPEGYVLNPDDCDDSNNSIYPGAPGTQEGIDNNCNLVIDPDENLICADFDDNGIVSTTDLLILISEIGCSSSCTSDLSGDGLVGLQDLLVFLSQFGSVCP